MWFEISIWVGAGKILRAGRSIPGAPGLPQRERTRNILWTRIKEQKKDTEKNVSLWRAWKMLPLWNYWRVVGSPWRSSGWSRIPDSITSQTIIDILGAVVSIASQSLWCKHWKQTLYLTFPKSYRSNFFLFRKEEKTKFIKIISTKALMLL